LTELRAGTNLDGMTRWLAACVVPLIATAGGSGQRVARDESGRFVSNVLAVQGPAGAARPADPVVRHGKVDARVLEDTAGGSVGRFLVVLRPQVDAGALTAKNDDWAGRGRRLVRALRRTAAGSQAGILTRLRNGGTPFRSYWITNVVAVQGDRSVVAALAARPEVRSIEPDRPITAAVAAERPTRRGAPQAVEWNVERIGAPRVWQLGYAGQEIVYANADTGVLWEHPAIKRQYRGWDGTTARHDYNWWDAVHGDIDGNGGNPCGFDSRVPCDDVAIAHGTAAMGIGVGDDGAGNQVGVAPRARWIACRNMDEGVGRPSTYIECLQFFLAPTDLNGASPNPDRRPHVISNSYGCPPFEGCSASSLQAALTNLRAAGVFLAAAAGNDGPNCSTITWPPALDAAVETVGATDANDAITSFSSRGPVTADGSGRVKPDLVAPGAGIRVAVRDNQYAIRRGTSYAVPHLAGAVAVFWSAFGNLRGNVERTEQILEQSALHLPSAEACGGHGPTAVPNPTYGFGRIDLSAAYVAAESEFPPSLEVADTSLAEGSGQTAVARFVVTLSRASTRTVTVRFATADRTARAPVDYAASSGVVTFGSGETEKTITVEVVADTRLERDETFALTLSEPVNATLGRGEAVGTITNDDADTVAPVVSSLRVRPSSFRASRGGHVHFVLSENASLTFIVERLRSGARPLVAARFSRRAVTGRNVFRLTTRLTGKPLAPGGYRLTVRARDSAGNRGRPKSAGFRVRG